MNVSATFVRRPVATTLVMAAILIFGAIAFVELPVSDLPNVDFPTIQVSASLPGASPETMASAVATPLERQFSTIPGLESMTSASTNGNTNITLQFSLERDVDDAAQDVQSGISRVTRSLPKNMTTPPSFRKVNPADMPILFIALTSPTLPLPELNEYGETYLAQRISTVNGVAQVMVFGSQKYAVRVQLDPRQLAARGIGINEVAAALDQNNSNLPTGTLYGPAGTVTVQAEGQLTRAEQYRPLIVTWRNGAPVRLEELGQVLDGVEENRSMAWFGNRETEQRTVMLAVMRQPGTNTVKVAKAIRAQLDDFQRFLPASVSMQVMVDRSETIEESVLDVQFTLLLTLGLVVLVIFLFLRSLSATLIPSLALPFSVVGTFSVMYLLDFSMNNLSLMALTLAVGFVVDDAIVMLENIVRHLEQGKPPLRAALEGAGEVGFTIVSMTLSLAAVFIPVIFMGGIAGRLFREFAITIAAAVLISGFVSLTLTPMLCSRFLRSAHERRHGRLYRWSERLFEHALQAYRITLEWSLRHRRIIVLGSLAILVGTVLVWRQVPMGFIPSEDTSVINVATEGPEGVAFEAMIRYHGQLHEVIRKNPNVLYFMSSIGRRGSMGATNSGNMTLRLKPRSQRTLSADQIVQQLRGQLGWVIGVRAYPQNPPLLRIGARSAKAQYQYTLQGADVAELYRSAAELERRLQALPELVDVTSDLQLRNPEVKLTIRRDRAASLGISAEAIQAALYDAYGSRMVSTIYGDTNTFQVIMELLPEHQQDASSLPLLHLRTSTGRLLPLETVAEIRTGVGPLAVNHQGQLPAVTLSFDLKPGHSLGQATAAIERVARQVLPPSVTPGFQGTAQAFQSSIQGLGLLLVLAILVIYLVLGVLYESFIHPITILSALPFAGFGALLTLWVFQVELSIYAFVGVILLVGLVKKNGIMMVDFAIERRNAGRSPAEAILEASLVRFRPIMMTTMAALMGTLPIAIGFGAGGEARRPLGLAVVGGLLFSQLLTLFVTPVVYVYLERFQTWLGRKRTAVSSGAAPDP